MDTSQWPQEIGLVKPMEELVGSSTSSSAAAAAAAAAAGGVGGARAGQAVETRARPQKKPALNCPRCNSTNTKFCYYNNYSLTQPRYFCKTCRRYWTEGGSLRNVPVGGGSRKNKRSSSAAAAATTTITISATSSATITTTTSSLASTAAVSSSLSSMRAPPPKFHQGQDLNLAFPHPPALPDFEDLPSMDASAGSTNPSTALSAMEFLRSGMSARGISSFIPMPISAPETGAAVYPSGFELPQFGPPTLNFPLDGVTSGGPSGGCGGGGGEYSGMQGVHENAGRMLFPFEDLRQVPSGSGGEFEQSRGGQGGDPPGFWNAMMSGGGGGGGGSRSW